MEILILNLLSDILWTPNPFCAGKHTVRTRKLWIEYRLSSAFLLELRNVATDISHKELAERFSLSQYYFFYIPNHATPKAECYIVLGY